MQLTYSRLLVEVPIESQKSRFKKLKGDQFRERDFQGVDSGSSELRLCSVRRRYELAD